MALGFSTVFLCAGCYYSCAKRLKRAQRANLGLVEAFPVGASAVDSSSNPLVDHVGGGVGLSMTRSSSSSATGASSGLAGSRASLAASVFEPVVDGLPDDVVFGVALPVAADATESTVTSSVTSPSTSVSASAAVAVETTATVVHDGVIEPDCPPPARR